MTQDEMLSAYVDGELTDQQMLQVEQLVVENPVLAQRLRYFAELDVLVAEASAEIDQQPLPDSIQRLLQPATTDETARTNVVPFPQRSWTPKRWAAAAAVTIALALGAFDFGTVDRANPRLAEEGNVPEDSPLYSILETQPSGRKYALQGQTDVQVEPLTTFLAVSGDYCREIELSSTRLTERALACRSQARWEIHRITPVDYTPGQYVPATAGTEADYNTYVDSILSNPVLGIEEEREMLKSHWHER